MRNQDKQPAIVFDLGGVLIDWNPKHLYRKMFDGDEAKSDYFLTVICPSDWNAKLDAGYPFAQAIEERIELFPEYTPYIRAYSARWEEMIGGEIAETVKILAVLRDQEYPLFALSNWSAETYPLVYRRFEFLSWFEEVILSGDVKTAKPDPAIYEAALRRIHREAHECLFIDDSAQNVLAASRVRLSNYSLFFP